MPYRPAITTVSLGRACFHDIREKLFQASRHGFEGIELFYEDIEYLARTFPGDLSRENLLEAARQIKTISNNLGLTILNLQPFMFYEGLIDRAEHERIINEKVPLWFDILQILEADTILIPSNFLPPDPETGAPRITGDMDVIISDLIEIAELGAKQTPVVKFAYEALAWGTYVDTWEKSWDVVCRVNRPNFGIALDTFNIAARVYAEPAAWSGKTKTAEEDLRLSMLKMSMTLDVNKIFVIQLADGERLSEPMRESHPWYVKEQPARMTWSRNARLFPCEKEMGAYLPVLEVLRCILSLGFEGWLSMEVFSRTLANPESTTPYSHAQRGSVSWSRLVEQLCGKHDLAAEVSNNNPSYANNSYSLPLSSPQALI